MSNTSFNCSQDIPMNELAQSNESSQITTIEKQLSKPANNSASIFKGASKDNSAISSTTTTVNPNTNIFSTSQTNVFTDTSSIFTGMRRGTSYSLFSTVDNEYTAPKLTKEDIATQKAPEGPKRTNPKASVNDIQTSANPYEAYRNPELPEELSLKDSLANVFENLFGNKK